MSRTFDENTLIRRYRIIWHKCDWFFPWPIGVMASALPPLELGFTVMTNFYQRESTALSHRLGNWWKCIYQPLFLQQQFLFLILETKVFELFYCWLADFQGFNNYCFHFWWHEDLILLTLQYFPHQIRVRILLL